MECAFTSPVRTECGIFVLCCMQCLYVCVSCLVVCGCVVSRRYIHVCNCDMFGVVNVYVDHLKLCVLCINGRRYSRGTWGKWDMCLCFVCGGVAGFGGEWVGRLVPGSGRVGLCYVCVCCES